MTVRPLFATLWTLALIPLFGYAQVDTLSLFKVQMEGDSVVYDAHLPGVLQQTLMDQGVVPHHFVEMNEDSVQWVSDHNWIYSTVFSLDSTDLATSIDYRLHLGTVDTYAEIYMNGGLVGTTNDLFRRYTFSVRGYLHTGENRLVLKILSPTRIAHVKYLSTGFNYPADNDRSSIHYAPFVRKSQYHFGWDWGPRLISIGVGEPIRLERVAGPTLEECYIRTELNPDQARVVVSSVVKTHGGNNAELSVSIRDPEGNTIAKKVCKAAAGDSLEFRIQDPYLWWPNGAGEQHLYSLVRTVREGPYTASDTVQFGIREIRLLQEKDSIGESFTFVVNGQPLYIKGANYLPHDRRFGGGGRTLDQLFREDLVPAHFNMLRIWGGGAYETEEFYRLADRYGILIWQDFPFACSTYPNDPSFRETVATEVRDQLTRIRNHPSIALFCGNNEVLEGLKHWGWKKKYGYTDEQWQRMFEDYESFFVEYLASLVQQYAPHVDYIHGSPVSSNWGRPASLLSGDSHYWGVWFGGEVFTTFDTNYGRFASEFGFQSFPEMKTIRSFAPDTPIDSLNIDHPVLKYRQRSFIGNKTITNYMSRSYPVPDNFHDYVYVGQILQGNGMDYALRAIRRGYPTNMGALYWQLNDVWPTVSWSSIDYWGNYKALHYRVRDAYAPTIVDIVAKDDRYELWLVSDSRSLGGQVTVQIEACDYTGLKLWQKSLPYTVKTSPLAQEIGYLDTSLLKSQQLYVEIKAYDHEGQLIAKQVFYPILPKEMDLPSSQLKCTVEANAGQLKLGLSSPVLVKDLFIETPYWQGARYSDNFLDILPGETYTVVIKHPDITSEASVRDLIFTSLNDILSR